MYFKRKDKFRNFKKDDLKKYKELLKIIKAFKEYYVPDKKFKLREIDIYLWSVGRKYFSKKH